jgi:hypothetical protein
MTDVEIVDLPFQFKNETKVSVGKFDEENTEFTHLSVLKNKGNIFFVISDSTGFVT